MSSPQKRFYAQPSLDHHTGDIWKGLPSNGILKQPHCTGIVITPACDLANRKVETLTYLPIISIESLFCMRAFYPDVRAAIVSSGKSVSLPLDEILKKNHLPKRDDVRYIKELLDDRALAIGSNVGLVRCHAGCELLTEMLDLNVHSCDTTKVPKLFGDKRYEDLKKEIVTNSYSLDLHFLTKDDEDPEWSSVPNHGVVLFRYPQTAPIEIFDLAQDVTAVDWESVVDELGTRLPFVRSFRDLKPLKTLKLRDEFLGDLLTRFIALYVRLGSPDLTKENVAQIIQEIGA